MQHIHTTRGCYADGGHQQCRTVSGCGICLRAVQLRDRLTQAKFSGHLVWAIAPCSWQRGYHLRPSRPDLALSSVNSLRQQGTHKIEDGGGDEACSSMPQAARLATLATLRPPMGVWGKMGYLVPDLNSWPSEGAQLGRAAAICSKRLLAPVALGGRLVSPPAGWRRSGAVRRAWGEQIPWPTTGCA